MCRNIQNTLQAHVAEKRDRHTIGVMEKFLFSLHSIFSEQRMDTKMDGEQTLNGWRTDGERTKNAN